jgi:hypothetical protein
MFDVGVIVGAHKAATIANAIQGKLSAVLEGAMEEHEFDMKDWGVFCHSKANRIDHVWYRMLVCRSTGGGCRETERLRIYATAGCELTVPADKLKRLQKAVRRFVKEAEEHLDVKEWGHGELAQMARKAYKTAQPAINATIDTRLLQSFCIGDVWEMWPRRTRLKRGRMSGTMRRRSSSKASLTAGRAPPQALARSIMLNPDEAGAWSGDMKKEANAHAIALRRTLHRLLGEVVAVKHLGEAQAIPEEGALRGGAQSVEMSWRLATCAWL